MRTPDRGSLHGITRRTVLELCSAMNLNASIAPIHRDELEGADEVFLATTAGGVMPASRVNSTIYGNDRPGPISLRLKAAYWQLHRDGTYRTEVIRDL